jgi:cobalt-zinc-cadmium efflux system membrane fusion protein
VVEPSVVEPTTAWRKGSALRRWLRRTIPATLVIAVLIGLAVWGHNNEWNLPKFSALMGGDGGAAEDWCKEHNVAESQCIECNSALVPRETDYGWCKEHGVAQCPLHHPEIAQVQEIISVTSADFERAQKALATLPRSENNSRCKLHERRIQFASETAVDKAGIDIAVVQQRPIVEAVVANGEVVYDQTHAAHLASRVAGNAWRVHKQVGDAVRKGDVLALIDATDVGRAKSEFLQAIAQLRLKQSTTDRLQPLAKDSLVPGRQFQEAMSALQEAKIKVRSTQQILVNLGLPVRAEEFGELSTDQIAHGIQFLGLPSEIASTFDSEITTSNLFPLRAPLDGIVVERDIVVGEVVDASTNLFTVADVSRMWLLLDARQDDAKYLSIGQRVLFRPSDGKDEPEIQGSVAWVSTSADAQTRTVKVRVDLPNNDGRLRANTFGTGRIVLREESKAIVIPSEAVHWDGCCNVVFVRDKDYLKKDAAKFFHIRKVRPGVKEVETTEVIAGLLPGEVIASKNSVVLEAQLLKSNLGAGCGCADGH